MKNDLTKTNSSSIGVLGYPKKVQRIHNEFNTASDRTLLAAQEILAEVAKKDIQKGQRLKRIGFSRANQVEESDQLVSLQKKALEDAELVQYYRNKYPLHKFIMEADIDRICSKYNLVRGPLNLFKGFVPDKNLRDIENFRFDRNDSAVEYNYKVTEVNFSWALKEQDREIVRKYLKTINSTIVSDVPPSKLDRASLRAIFLEEDIKKKTGIRIDLVNDCRLQVDGSDTRTICAPLKDMDMTGKILRGNKIQDAFSTIFSVKKDPIVIEKVKGGGLIVTAWGDEASDPLVVNEINN
jgi:hypothetical protein